jgi:hypothetical protein
MRILALLAAICALPAYPLKSPAATPEQLAEAALLPFLDVLCSPPANDARAFRVQGKLESISTLQFEANNLPEFDFAIQPAGRMRLSFPIGGTTVTACRDGQKAWAAPGQLLGPLLENLPSQENKKIFQPLQLPFSGKQLGLLPVLLEVQDKGSAPLDGANCRVLDVRVRPEISRLLPSEAAAWSVRLWLTADGALKRAGIRTPEGSAVLRIDQIRFLPELPASLWSQPEDAKAMTPAAFEKIAARILQSNSSR